MDLLLSIHRNHVENTENGKKTFEFRDYRPNQGFKRVWIYTTKPVGRITHVLRVGRILQYPAEIPTDGVGNKAFNEGNKTEFAYHIDEVTKLNDPMSLSTMREFDVYPPQQLRYIKEQEPVYDVLRDRL